jgi:hypothetical protein
MNARKWLIFRAFRITTYGNRIEGMEVAAMVMLLGSAGQRVQELS